MNNTVYLVHVCDDWGTHIGIAGVYTKKSVAIEHILQDYRDNYDFTDSELDEIKYQLEEYAQTQGVTKVDNYDIETRTLDEWTW